MLRELWNTIRRWRTWVVNTIGAALIAPELLVALLGFDWGMILPSGWMPYVTLAIIILNVWMRPRPAVLPTDPEVDMRLDRIGKH